jgi:hypothetical protein
MKGMIFNLLEEFVCDGWGEDAYEQILARCPVHAKGPHVGPATYPDADLFAIIDKTTEKLGISTDDALQAFGAFALPRMLAKFPRFGEGHRHPSTFFKSIDNIIHVEVRKLMKDAEPPSITVYDTDPQNQVLVYESRRKLCSLLKGLVTGTSHYFKVPIFAEETLCMRTGSSFCQLALHYPDAAEVVS